MTLSSIFKTVIQIYCSTLLFNNAAPSPLSSQTIHASSNPLPLFVQDYAEMTPTAPPEDRGSGR